MEYDAGVEGYARITDSGPRDALEEQRRHRMRTAPTLGLMVLAGLALAGQARAETTQ